MYQYVMLKLGYFFSVLLNISIQAKHHLFFMLHIGEGIIGGIINLLLHTKQATMFYSLPKNYLVEEFFLTLLNTQKLPTN